MSERRVDGYVQPAAPRARFAEASNIYAALLLFGLTLAGVYLLAQLRALLIIVFLALLVASGIAGPVRRLERRGVSTALAALLVYAVVIGTVGALIWFVLPRVLGQAADVATDLPNRVRDLEQLRLRLQELSGDYPILSDLDARLLALAGSAGTTATGWLLDLPQRVAGAVFTLVSVLTIAFLLLTTRVRLLALILSLVQPRHRAATERVLAEMGDRLGAYLRAKLIVMVVIGALVWATLFLLGSAYAVLAAIFAGLTEAVPRIGPWFGRFAIVLAVLPLGWRAVAIALVAHVAISNFKGYVLSPLVEGDQLDIHPLTAFLAIIAGGILLGWVGALIAVPVAAVLQVLVEDVFIPWRRARLAPADATTAGAGPAEATRPATPAPPPPVRLALGTEDTARGTGGTSNGR